MRYLPKLPMFTAILVLMMGVLSGAEAWTVKLLKTYDYPVPPPGTVIISTAGLGINERGDITGDFVDSNNVRRSFVRFVNGSFSTSFAHPDDNQGFTQALGINSLGTVVGWFKKDANFHGFILRKGAFSTFDVPGSSFTQIFGINELGHMSGTYQDASTGVLTPFVKRGNQLTTFQPPGATNNIGPLGTGTFAEGINNFGVVGGLYTDADSHNHGYLRTPSGKIHTIDVPGATDSLVQDLNDQGWIVGRYIDAAGKTHGFVAICGTFLTFDGPEAVATSLNGINDLGFISGRYDDAAGIRHGLIAQIVPDKHDGRGFFLDHCEDEDD